MKYSFLPSLPVVTFAALLSFGPLHGQVADVPNARSIAGIPVNEVEANVVSYPLPDLLTLSDGRPVKDAATWTDQRRPEIVKFYETQVYGRIPATAPKVTWEILSVDRSAMGGTAILKQLAGHMGGPDGPVIKVTLYTPAAATRPVPVLVAIQFGALPARARSSAGNPTPAGAATAAPAGEAARPVRPGAPIARLLASGFGYATLTKGDIETDIEGASLNPNVNIVRKLALAPGQNAPAPDEWGAIAAWAWGLSRVVDYLETDRAVDATRVAITGGSRLGKTVLWAGVNDPRIALVIACSSGSGGAKLARHKYGETVAHLVAPTRYPYQFAANYRKYAAHPEDMPMDTHMLVAAMAPRPLLLHTAAKGDNWSDPKGEYLAAIAATPAYRLLGKEGLDRTPEQGMVTGEFLGNDLAFYLNDGGHAALNWDIALPFLTRHLHPGS